MRGIKLSDVIRDMPLERKLISIFLFLIILPMFVLSYSSFDRYSESIENNTIAYVTELAGKMEQSLDDYIADMKRLSAVPGAVEEIRESLRISNSYYERPSQQQSEGHYIIPQNEGDLLAIQKKVEESIYFLNSVKEGASSIYLFDKYGNGYYRIQAGGVRSDINTTYAMWQQVADSAGGNAVLVSTQEFTNDFKRKRYVFTVVRNIFSPALERLGLIAVDANISVIERFVKDLDKVTGGQTLILDERNQVIFDSHMAFLAQNKSDDPMVEQATDQQGSFAYRNNGADDIVIYRQSPNTGWKIFISVPIEHLMKEAVASRNFTIVTALIIIGFALCTSIFLSYALTKPLRSLMQLMKKVQTGDLDVVFPVKHRDEAGMLGFHFNRMLGRIRELINDNYFMRLKRKEAELYALQSQINPHFLYNTLESIRMTAELNDDHDAADMIHLLGKMLRYSINVNNEVVRLEEELGHLEAFFRIVDYRYPNRFELKLADFTPIRTMNVVKLIFQPIFENAVLHGLDESKERLVLELTYKEERDDTLVFLLRDNGRGMEESVLEKLRAMLQVPITSDTDTGKMEKAGGVGLRNVNERIQLMYGEHYGLTVNSVLGQGTEVMIRLPITGIRSK